MDDQGWAFMGQEQADLLSRLFRHPIKFAIFLRTPEGEDGPIDVELHGSIFGFGPLPAQISENAFACCDGRSNTGWNRKRPIRKAPIKRARIGTPAPVPAPQARQINLAAPPA